MKKNVLILAVLVALIGVAAVAGLISRQPAQTQELASAPALVTTDGTELPTLSLPLNKSTDANGSRGLKWLIAGASAEEAAAETEATPSDETEASEMTVEEMREYIMNYAQAYLVVTIGNYTYAPIALLDEYDIPIRQTTGEENILHVTPTSVVMASSNCEGQDCVDEGEVNIETMNDRILYNMILCLPNQVYVELYTNEMLADALLGTAETTEAE